MAMINKSISKSLIAVILGGGAGSRLYPLTSSAANLQFLLQVSTDWLTYLFPIVLIQQ